MLYKLPECERVCSGICTFATELGELIADSHIDAWIYGHSHTNIDVEINRTKIVSNQMGYIFQDEHITNGFEPGKFLVIE